MPHPFPSELSLSLSHAFHRPPHRPLPLTRGCRPPWLPFLPWQPLLLLYHIHPDSPGSHAKPALPPIPPAEEAQTNGRRRPRRANPARRRHRETPLAGVPPARRCPAAHPLRRRQNLPFRRPRTRPDVFGTGASSAVASCRSILPVRKHVAFQHVPPGAHSRDRFLGEVDGQLVAQPEHGGVASTFGRTDKITSLDTKRKFRFKYIIRRCRSQRHQTPARVPGRTRAGKPTHLTIVSRVTVARGPPSRLRRPPATNPSLSWLNCLLVDPTRSHLSLRRPRLLPRRPEPRHLPLVPRLRQESEPTPSPPPPPPDKASGGPKALAPSPRPPLPTRTHTPPHRSPAVVGGSGRRFLYLQHECGARLAEGAGAVCKNVRRDDSVYDTSSKGEREQERGAGAAAGGSLDGTGWWNIHGTSGGNTGGRNRLAAVGAVADVHRR